MVDGYDSEQIQIQKTNTNAKVKFKFRKLNSTKNLKRETLDFRLSTFDLLILPNGGHHGPVCIISR